MKLCLLLLACLCLVSCEQKTDKRKLHANISHPKRATIAVHNKIIYKGRFGPDSINTFYPNDSLFYKNILTTGVFHQGEVMPNASSFKWVGLFKNKAGYYLAKTTLKVAIVKDEIVDDEGEKTGNSVTTPNSDTSIALIAAKAGLAPRKIDTIATNFSLMPGEQRDFTFQNIPYKVYAFGNKVRVGNGYAITGYRLYITAVINGRKTEQLLAMAPQIDLAPRIIMLADIDGDDIADVLMDTSMEENVSAVTLYLSKGAPNGKLLKLIGQHVVTGC